MINVDINNSYRLSQVVNDFDILYCKYLGNTTQKSRKIYINVSVINVLWLPLLLYLRQSIDRQNYR